MVNGVFLLALCFSISLEAIGRFITVPGRRAVPIPYSCPSVLLSLSEISSPKFVAIVGSFGLASNLVGLVLFHGQYGAQYTPLVYYD